jgi:hypothetical protein
MLSTCRSNIGYGTGFRQSIRGNDHQVLGTINPFNYTLINNGLTSFMYLIISAPPVSR